VVPVRDVANKWKSFNFRLRYIRFGVSYTERVWGGFSTRDSPDPRYLAVYCFAPWQSTIWHVESKLKAV